jgi:two-component system, OmpR family, sensor histidine kinase VanS
LLRFTQYSRADAFDTFRIGDGVDLDDLALCHGESQHGEGSSIDSDNCSGSPIHQCWMQLGCAKSALLDVARNDPNRDNGELLDRLHAVNTRAINLTEALLLLSRADQRSYIRERVDLSLFAEEATETLLPLAEKHGVTIETSGDVAPRSANTRTC